jgi:alpha-N-acetylglucosaminidase
MTELAEHIDHLAGNQQETLGSWIADARAAGDTPQEKDRFAQEAKAIVTVWGGQGHLSDYASRAWQGLYVGYYLPAGRFISMPPAPQPLPTIRWTRPPRSAVLAWEQHWLADKREWPRVTPKTPVADIRQILRETQP